MFWSICLRVSQKNSQASWFDAPGSLFPGQSITSAGTCTQVDASALVAPSPFLAAVRHHHRSLSLMAVNGSPAEEAIPFPPPFFSLCETGHGAPAIVDANDGTVSVVPTVSSEAHVAGQRAVASHEEEDEDADQDEDEHDIDELDEDEDHEDDENNEDDDEQAEHAGTELLDDAILDGFIPRNNVLNFDHAFVEPPQSDPAFVPDQGSDMGMFIPSAGLRAGRPAGISHLLRNMGLVDAPNADDESPEEPNDLLGGIEGLHELLSMVRDPNMSHEQRLELLRRARGMEPRGSSGALEGAASGISRQQVELMRSRNSICEQAVGVLASLDLFRNAWALFVNLTSTPSQPSSQVAVDGLVKLLFLLQADMFGVVALLEPQTGSQGQTLGALSSAAAVDAPPPPIAEVAPATVAAASAAVAGAPSISASSRTSPGLVVDIASQEWKTKTRRVLRGVAIDWICAVLAAASDGTKDANSNRPGSASTALHSVMVPTVLQVVHQSVYQPLFWTATGQSAADGTDLCRILTAVKEFWMAAHRNSPKAEPVPPEDGIPPPPPFGTCMIESAHKYGPHITTQQQVCLPGASHLLIEFDPRSSTEKGDVLEIKSAWGVHATLNGSGVQWRKGYTVPGDTAVFSFRTGAGAEDVSHRLWGYRVYCTALRLPSFISKDTDQYWVALASMSAHVMGRVARAMTTLQSSSADERKESSVLAAPFLTAPKASFAITPSQSHTPSPSTFLEYVSASARYLLMPAVADGIIDVLHPERPFARPLLPRFLADAVGVCPELYFFDRTGTSPTVVSSARDEVDGKDERDEKSVELPPSLRIAPLSFDAVPPSFDLDLAQAIDKPATRAAQLYRYLWNKIARIEVDHLGGPVVKRTVCLFLVLLLRHSQLSQAASGLADALFDLAQSQEDTPSRDSRVAQWTKDLIAVWTEGQKVYI
jgi:hypothetical protein